MILTEMKNQKKRARTFNFTPLQSEQLERVRQELSDVLGVQLTATAALHMCIQQAAERLNKREVTIHAAPQHS